VTIFSGKNKRFLDPICVSSLSLWHMTTGWFPIVAIASEETAPLPTTDGYIQGGDPMNPEPLDPVLPATSPEQSPVPAKPAFLGLPSAASMLYLLSAACLLGGAALVLAGPAADEGRLLERLGMIATALVYQLAVLAVAVLVCRWQRGNDDAIALTVLLAALAGGGAATLDTIAYHLPAAALVLGLGGAGLAVTAGAVAARRVSGAWPRGLAGVLIAVLALDHLLPGLLGQAAATTTPDELAGRFALAWHLLLAAGGVLVGLAVRARPQPGDADLPVVQRLGFRWVLAMVVLATAGLHHYLLAYALDLRFTVADLLPLAVVLAAVLDRLAHSFHATSRPLMPVLHAGLGVVLALAVGAGEQVLPGTRLATLPFWLVAGGVALAAAAIPRRAPGYALVAGGWLALGCAMLGSAPGHAVFHLGWAGLVVIGLLAGFAVWHRSPRLLTAACASAWLGATMTEPIAAWLAGHGLFPAAVGLGGASAAVLILAAATPALVARNLQVLCALVCAGCLMALTLPTSSVLHAPIVASLVHLTGGAVLAWRTRHPHLLIPHAVPLTVQAPGLAAGHLGWCAVGAAFVMLAVGAVLSRRAAQRAQVRP
jgi:hypothetical protein